MTKYTALDQNSLQVAHRAMAPAKGSGLFAGFSNILGKELGDWFGTRRWLVQSIIWIAIFNVALGLVLFVAPMQDPSGEHAPEGYPGASAGVYMNGLAVLFNTVALMGSIGIIILTQDEVIQEKQSGTAAWILTKPVSRVSFILSKLLANFVGGLIFIIAIPSLVAYLEILLASGQRVPLLLYTQALAVILLTLLFYISLTLMLGTFFEQRAPVLAAAFGLLFGGMIISQFVPSLKLGYILPLTMDRVALTIVQGQSLPAAMTYEVITTALFSVLFTIAALWRFGDEEF